VLSTVSTAKLFTRAYRTCLYRCTFYVIFSSVSCWLLHVNRQTMNYELTKKLQSFVLLVCVAFEFTASDPSCQYHMVQLDHVWPGAQPRLQSWGVQFLSLVYYYLLQKTIREVYPVWCSRLHNRTLFIEKLRKKLRGSVQILGVQTPDPNVCAHVFDIKDLFYCRCSRIYKK